MRLIEQAVFTSVDTAETADYRIAAHSKGLLDADARELAVWCPTHDALLDPDTASLNFHPLPSGAYCLSQTTSRGWDCSIHGGQRSATHCLIVPPELLVRFANNPFALARTAANHGAFESENIRGSRLPSLSFPGGAAAVAPALLADLAQDPGPEGMAAVVHMARDGLCLALAGSSSPERLFDGLLNCLPPQCRLEFTFSTGLKFSPQRPFRLIALSNDQAEQLWVASHPNVIVFDLGRPAPLYTVLDGWARLIERVLVTRQVSFLAAQLSKRRFDLSPSDLPALGLQLLEELDAYEFRGDEEVAIDPTGLEAESPRAHAAHHQFEKSVEAAQPPALLGPAPSTYVRADSPQVLEQLERLDDLVYEAIGGRPQAMQQLRLVWPKLSAELSEDLLAESREQYLRYAISIWEDNISVDGVRDPACAVRALDVLCLLVGGE